jgi:hypothetical protein
VTGLIQTQIDAKVAAASPTLTGTVTIPVPAAGVNTPVAVPASWVHDELALRAWSPAGGSFPSGALGGWRYLASSAGTINGVTFAVGDVIEALGDGASTSTFSTHWRRVSATFPIAFAFCDSDTAATVGLMKFGIPIGPELAGANVVAFRVVAHTASPDGSTTFTVNRRRSGSSVEVLSTDLTLPVSTYSAATAAINTSNDDLAAGDMLYPEVSAVPTTAPFGVSGRISVRWP